MAFSLAGAGQMMQGAFKQGQDAAALLLQQQQAKQAELTTGALPERLAQEAQQRKAQVSLTEQAIQQAKENVKKLQQEFEFDNKNNPELIRHQKALADRALVDLDTAKDTNAANKISLNYAKDTDVFNRASATGGGTSAPAPTGSAFPTETESFPGAPGTVTPPSAPSGDTGGGFAAGSRAAQMLDAQFNAKLTGLGAETSQNRVKAYSADMMLRYNLPALAAQLQAAADTAGITLAQAHEAWLDLPSSNPKFKGKTNRDELVAVGGRSKIQEQYAAIAEAAAKIEQAGPEAKARVDVLQSSAEENRSRAGLYDLKGTAGAGVGLGAGTTATYKLPDNYEKLITVDYDKAFDIMKAGPPPPPKPGTNGEVAENDKALYNIGFTKYNNARLALPGLEALRRMGPYIPLLEQAIPGFLKASKNPDFPGAVENVVNAAIRQYGDPLLAIQSVAPKILEMVRASEAPPKEPTLKEKVDTFVGPAVAGAFKAYKSAPTKLGQKKK